MSNDLAKLWRDFDAQFQKDRPLPGGNSAALAAIVGGLDPGKDRFICMMNFKASGRQYHVGDVFTPADRIQAVKLAQAGHILPEAEALTAQRYQANRDKHARAKKLYQDIGNAQSQVSRARGDLQQARAALDAATDALKQAENRAARLEAEFIQEVS